jgi:thiol-disulfide isomerase/thioredoxin
MRSRTLAVLACMALMMARGQAFHVTAKTGFHHQSQPFLSTQLSARQNQNRRKSQTAAYYSSTADPPLTDKVPANFGSRMRNLVLSQQQVELERLSQQQQPSPATTKKSKHNPAKPAFVEEAVSLKEYKQLVADEHERLVVVRFYAKWCRACKAVEPLFYRMAHSMPDIKFVEVPVLEENANLHQGLGVPALPFAHIYSPTAGLVEELRMCKKEFKTFQSVVENYREGRCTNLELDPETGMFSSPYPKDKEDKPQPQS